MKDFNSKWLLALAFVALAFAVAATQSMAGTTGGVFDGPGVPRLVVPDGPGVPRVASTDGPGVPRIVS